MSADPEAVAAFLRDHPDWLTTRPDVYASLTPPRRVHGETMADHMQARIDAERARGEAAQETARDVLRASRAAACLTAKTQRAVLALLRAPDAIECILQELPSLLGIESARLHGPLTIERAGVEHMSLPGIDTLLDGQDVRLRGLGRPDFALHGEAAPLIRQDALLRLPRSAPTASPLLLVLAARDKNDLAAPHARQTLRFLAEAAAAALDRDWGRHRR